MSKDATKQEFHSQPNTTLDRAQIPADEISAAKVYWYTNPIHLK